MYLLSQIKRNPAITTVTKRGIIGGGRGLLSSSLRNIKALLIYESGSLGIIQVPPGRLSAIRTYAGVADCKAQLRLVNWHDFCLAILETKQSTDNL